MLGYVDSSVKAWHSSMPINSTIYFVANQFSYCPVSLLKMVTYYFLKYVFERFVHSLIADDKILSSPRFAG